MTEMQEIKDELRTIKTMLETILQEVTHKPSKGVNIIDYETRARYLADRANRNAERRAQAKRKGAKEC